MAPAPSASLARRRMGATDLRLSEIGFGSGGNAGLMVGDHQEEQRQVIAHALACGITYFDTSPDYGNGSAESNLGRIFSETDAPSIIINTKVEVRTENLGDIAGHVVDSVEKSLVRLGRDHVDIVQIHNGPVAKRPNLGARSYRTLGLEDYERADGAMEGIRRLLRDGKTRYAGFICRGEDRAEVLQLLDSGLFNIINIPFSLINPSATRGLSFSAKDRTDYGGVIEEASQRGVGVAVFSPLAGGLLTGAILAGRQTHPYAREKDLAALDSSRELQLAGRFDELARRHGLGLTELAYRFALSPAGVTTVLGGYSCLEHVSDAVAAARNGPLPESILDEIREIHRAAASP